ncbi:MAG: hypothetical protein WAM28_07325 [Chlamydiales bacterium]
MNEIKTSRELQFENEYVRVWKTIIAPDQPLEAHISPRGHMIIGLKGGNLKHVDRNGKSSEVSVKTHEVHWLSQGHINLGKEPVEMMEIEMKTLQDQPLPNIPID